MATRHKFYGPNGIEVNFDEFVRLVGSTGIKTPVVVTMKKAKKKNRKRSRVALKRK